MTDNNIAAEPHKRLLAGLVHKKSANKSIMVVITKKIKHPFFKKFYNKTSKFMIHDEHNQAQVGDRVNFVSCRPVSKRKSYKLHSIIEKKS